MPRRFWSSWKKLAFTDWEGQRKIDTGNALATNGLLYESVMQIVKG
jgi:hypothetical protein